MLRRHVPMFCSSYEVGRQPVRVCDFTFSKSHWHRIRVSQEWKSGLNSGTSAVGKWIEFGPLGNGRRGGGRGGYNNIILILIYNAHAMLQPAAWWSIWGRRTMQVHVRARGTLTFSSFINNSSNCVCKTSHIIAFVLALLRYIDTRRVAM